MVLKLPQAQKRMFRIFENCVFCFFYKLLNKEVEDGYWESEEKC